MKFVQALNAINSPVLAILVIILGCVFDVVSHRYGLNSDSASGIIGAGIGLLTGQALSRTTTNTLEGHPTEVQQTTGAPTVGQTFQQPKQI